MGPCCRINEQNQSEGYYPAGVTSTTPLTRGVTRWYVYDGLGSKIAELDDNNNMTTSRQYDVYGAPRAGTQQGVAGTSSQGYVGSLGHVTDQSTGGLIYMQARYYDPALGRFVSEDSRKSGNNWYVYCDDCPTNEVDQTGSNPLLIAALVLALLGFIAGFCQSVETDYLNDDPINWKVAIVDGGYGAALGLGAGLVAAALSGVALVGIGIGTGIALSIGLQMAMIYMLLNDEGDGLQGNVSDGKGP
jgi:RHS repeat-associated protein